MTSNSRIHPLPLHLANQIAAGEVIERPASVVKELVENSIDAGASQIDIDIDGAGSKLIRVHDNGIGIHTEDLPLALSRHATSKLHSSEQLSYIDSLGFRGEALPSISSVSQLNITSRQHDSELGWQLSSEKDEVHPAPHPLGTTIEVRDLFFNLPARRRFLRSDKTEQNHILTTLYRLALSRFDIGFSYQVSNQNRLKLPSSNDPVGHQHRIAKICGQSFIKNAVYFEQSFDDIKLSGWLAKPSSHRPQTDIQYFFINGRVIRDRVINHAVRQAYADQIPAGRHAAYVLYLTLPLDRVDVNVHPTKHEVRFRDARLIHGLITSALTEALAQESEELTIKLEHTEHPGNTVAEHSATYQSEPKAKKTDLLSSPSIANSHVLFHQRYIIVEVENQPFLVDLQQAEHYLRQLSFQEAIEASTLKSRPVLVPFTVHCTEQEIDLVNKHAELLQQLAIGLAAQADGVAVKNIPSLLAQVNLKQFVETIVTALSTQKTNFEQLSQILQQLLPMLPITSVEHANQIIQQLDTGIFDPRWTRQLDQQTLSSLFSN
jgi:DNA mismatch repair protein MutL